MRRLINWAIRLYPSAWRARYGAEFHALIDQLDLRWPDLASVALGGLMMRLKSPGPCVRNRLRAIGIAASLLIAALAVAAADDITTGSEPSFVQEWFMLASAGVWFTAVGVQMSRRKPVACANTIVRPTVVLAILTALMAALAVGAIVRIAAGG